MAVLMVRSELTADASLAAMRARSKFGIAIAAMIRMIATTISNSINEKPFCFRISFSLFSDLKFWSLPTHWPIYSHFASQSPGYQRIWAQARRWFIFMAYHAFGDLIPKPEAAAAPASLWHILSASDKLCQIATGKTISPDGAIGPRKDSKLVPNLTCS